MSTINRMFTDSFRGYIHTFRVWMSQINEWPFYLNVQYCSKCNTSVELQQLCFWHIYFFTAPQKGCAKRSHLHRALFSFYTGTAVSRRVHFYLFATVDAVLAEDRSAACGHPHPGQRVAVNLVLLDHPLAFLMLKHRAGSAVKHFWYRKFKLLWE